MAGINKINPFVLPERVNPANLEDEYDHKRFKQWVSDLPIGNVSSTARALHTRLNWMNLHEMSPVARFEALELLLPSLGFVLEELRVHLTAKPLPLSKMNRLVARLHLELLVRITVGYKTVLAQFHDDSFTGYLMHKRTRVGASRRLLYFLGDLLQHEYSIYKVSSRFVWKEIHGVYYYAAQNELVNGEAKVSDDDLCGPLGITGLYKRILLLALANPNSLLRGEVKRVNDSLLNWLPEAELIPIKEEVPTNNLFLVDVQKDAPPCHMEECSREQIKKGWVLDVTKLDKVLEQEINSIKDYAGIQLRPTDEISIKLLSKLRAAWGRDVISREKRHKRAGIIDVTCGVKSLYQLLGGERPPESVEYKPGSPFYSIETDEHGLAVVSVARDEFIIDAGADLSSGFPSESEMILEEEIELDIIDHIIVDEIDSRACISVNESNRGCYLTWPGEGEHKGHVGELIGINPRENLDLSEAWSLGIVRWVRIQSHGLMGFGVELLDGEIKPVRLERWHEGDSSADIILGFQQKIAGNGTSLITQPFYSGDKDKLLLITDDGQFPVIPGEMQECTDAVMRFEIGAGAIDKVEAGQKDYSVSDDPFSNP